MTKLLGCCVHTPAQQAAQRQSLHQAAIVEPEAASATRWRDHVDHEWRSSACKHLCIPFGGGRQGVSDQALMSGSEAASAISWAVMEAMPSASAL